MARYHRVFTAFAIEDVWARDYLVGQGRNERTPFQFTDMSVKQPWDYAWKTQCRTRIRGCDGMIALLSRNTAKASGQLWEISCAREEGIPIMAIYTTRENRPYLIPTVLNGIPVRDWTWANIMQFLGKL